MSDSEKTPRLGKASIVAILSRIAEIRHFLPSQLDLIAKLPVRYWEPDEYIIREGAEPLDYLVIVLTGAVSVRKQVTEQRGAQDEQLEEIRAPVIVGENSFFTGLARSASVHAASGTVGILLTRADLVNLISVNKPSVEAFLRNIASQNLRRAESTAVLFQSTLQLALPQASIVRSSHYLKLAGLRERLEEKRSDLQDLRDLLGDILMYIRELNGNMETLYTFANLRRITITGVDIDAFNLPRDSAWRDLFRALAEELSRAQELVPLEVTDFKRILLDTIMATRFSKEKTIDYHAVVSSAARAHEEFFRIRDELGVTAHR